MHTPKNAFFYVLDRKTGKLISADPITKVSWSTGVDPKTGKMLVNPEARYGKETQLTVNPGPSGGHVWPPWSYSPQTGLMYIPGTAGQGGTYRAADDFEPQPVEIGPTGRGVMNMGTQFGGGQLKGGAGAGKGKGIELPDAVAAGGAAKQGSPAPLPQVARRSHKRSRPSALMACKATFSTHGTLSLAKRNGVRPAVALAFCGWCVGDCRQRRLLFRQRPPHRLQRANWRTPGRVPAADRADEPPDEHQYRWQPVHLRRWWPRPGWREREGQRQGWRYDCARCFTCSPEDVCARATLTITSSPFLLRLDRRRYNANYWFNRSSVRGGL